MLMHTFSYSATDYFSWIIRAVINERHERSEASSNLWNSELDLVPPNQSWTRELVSEAVRCFLCHCLCVGGKCLVFHAFAVCRYHIQVACQFCLHPSRQFRHPSVPKRVRGQGLGIYPRTFLWLERKDGFPEIRAALKDEAISDCLLLHHSCLSSPWGGCDSDSISFLLFSMLFYLKAAAKFESERWSYSCLSSLKYVSILTGFGPD